MASQKHNNRTNVIFAIRRNSRYTEIEEIEQKNKILKNQLQEIQVVQIKNKIIAKRYNMVFFGLDASAHPRMLINRMITFIKKTLELNITIVDIK